MKTEELMKAWIRTREWAERQRVESANAEAALKTAQNQLGCWLTPADVKLGEEFHVWIGSGVLRVKKLTDMGDGSDYVIDWRKEPDGKDRLEQGF